MLASAIIVFREVLEAALIISLVIAATSGVDHRLKWIGGGLFVGLLGACMAALMADVIADFADGIGQELLNAIVLFSAVLMLAWHNIWMKKHSTELTQKLNHLSRAITDGDQPLYALAIIISLAVFREGAEVVLFMHGLAAGGSNSAEMLSGGVLGLLAGLVIGLCLYFGLVRIPVRHLFKVTAGMILLLAAGLASQGAAYLVQSDLLPAFGYGIWDTSFLLSERSAVGSVLHTLIGYSEQPMGIQIIFYIATLLIIGGLMKLVNTPVSKPAANSTATTIAIISLFVSALSLGHSQAVQASNEITSPIVDQGEIELALKGHITTDNDPAKDALKTYEIKAAYSLTNRWHSLVSGEIEKEKLIGDHKYESTAWENIFQLTNQGEHWADLGLSFAYIWKHGTTDKAKTKLLMETFAAKTVYNLNLVIERGIGSGAEHNTEFGYEARAGRNLNDVMEVAVEAYGNFGDWNDPAPSNYQEHLLGPVLKGHIHTKKASSWVYEIGYLAGLTSPTPEGTFKFSLEYEFHL